MKVNFVAGNEEAKAVLDLNHIPWQESEEDGFSVEFPDSVQISNDGDAESRPSYWLYQVGQEKFVYDLDKDCLVVE